MKCKVCGSELTEGSLICKVCGSPITTDQPKPARTKEPVRPVEDVDFNWNTFDFPKPKKPEDIEMAWPQFNVHHKIDADEADEQIAASMASRRPVSIMRNDAQEGFVFTNAAPARPEPQVVPVVQYVPVQAVPMPAAPAAQQAPQNPAQSSMPQGQTAPQPVFSQTGTFAPVWTMPVQQPMPAAEPLWYTQPVAAVTSQGIPVQYVPVYAQPAGPYTIAMQRADGQIPGMPTKAEFAAAAVEADDEPVDENWIKSQLDDSPEDGTKAVPVFTGKIDAVEEPFKAFAFDEPENIATEEEPAVSPAVQAAAEAVAIGTVAVKSLSEADAEEAASEEVPAVSDVSEPEIVPEEPEISAEEPEAAEKEGETPAETPSDAEAPADAEVSVETKTVAEPAAEAAEPVEPAAAQSSPVAEIAAEEREAARSDRFYTFNKKNEEFQALLDAEYARVKAMRLGEVPPVSIAAVEPAAPEDPEDSKITYTSDISAAMASVAVDLPEPEAEDEDDVPLTVDAIIKAGASDNPDATRIWTAEEEGAPVFKLPEGILSQPDEVQAEELSSFESMLMSGTSSRDETTDETIKINLSKVRDAMVRPLAEDVTVPDFVDTEAEERAREAAAREAEAQKALEEKRKAEEELNKVIENEQISLRKQRLEEMARAREEFFGPSLSPVVKPTSEVGSIASKKDPAVKAAEEAAKAAAENADAETKTETPAGSGNAADAENSGEKQGGASVSETPAADSKDKTSQKSRKEKKNKAETDMAGYEEYTKQDYRRGGSKIVIFIIVVVVLALLLEGAKMMTTRFMPDSTVNVFLTNLETDVVTAVTKFFDTVVEGFNMLFKK